MKISRRNFLKAGAASGSLMALTTAGCGVKLEKADPTDEVSSSQEKVEPMKGELIPGSCRMCGGDCGIVGRVVDGRLVKIEGNPKHFNTPGGALCVRGNSGTKFVYDPDRVLHPLKRVGERGEGKFEKISWDEATSMIVEKMEQYKSTPEKVAWSGVIKSGDAHHHVMNKLYGTPSMIGRGRSICDGSKRTAAQLTFGWEQHHMGYDFQNSKYIVLWGRSITNGPHYAATPKRLVEAKEKGAKVVVIDPRYTPDAAVYADEWLPVKPGTDTALALAMANVIISEGLYDKDFVDNWTIGFDKLVKHVEQYTPQWAEGVTGIPVEAITKIATDMATTKPAFIDIQKGVIFHTNGLQAIRSIYFLLGLTGNIDVEGGLVFSQGAKKGAISNPPAPPKRPGLWDSEKYPIVKGGMLHQFYKKINEDKVKVWFLNENNPIMSIPEPDRLKQAMQSEKIELIISLDTYISETGMYADLILPDATCYERYQLLGSRANYPTITVRTPLVQPVGESRYVDDVMIEIGKKLGYGQYLPVNSAKEAFDLRLKNSSVPEIAQLSIDKIVKEHTGFWENPKKLNYKKYAIKLQEAELAGTSVEDGIVKDSKGNAIGVMVGETAYKGFNTPSKKFEFYCQKLEDKGYDGIPTWKDPEGYTIDNATEYPLRLISYHHIQTSQTRCNTFNNPYLMELRPENYLEISTQTAAKLGIKNGDMVEVSSAVGKASLKAYVTEGIHPDTVAMQHGFGHWSPYTKVALKRGANSNHVSRLQFDPVGGVVASNETLVKVRRVG